MKTLTFNNATELAQWVNTNILDTGDREVMMAQGVNNNFTIQVRI